MDSNPPERICSSCITETNSKGNLRLPWMLVDLRYDLRHWARSRDLDLSVLVVCPFDIDSPVNSAATLRQNATSNTTCLEDMVDVLETHACSFREEAVGHWNDDTGIQNCKENIPGKNRGISVYL